MIDWYNVQFYNQGDTEYKNYTTLFIHSEGSKFNHTAVFDLQSSGIPNEMIVLGKPATPGDATNTGYVNASDLGAWAY